METLTVIKSKERKSNQKLTILTKEVKHPNAGWGQCKSCSCRGFIEESKSNMICQNCGHHYKQHQ
jgi:acetyl-CoA carboxylase beta subunit